MKGYSTREVAELLSVSPARLRRLAREDFLQVGRGSRGEYHFSFHDVALLRTLLDLASERIPGQRILKAFRQLRGQLPPGQPLTAICVVAEGGSVVARDEDGAWDPESLQVHLDLPQPSPPDQQMALGPEAEPPGVHSMPASSGISGAAGIAPAELGSRSRSAQEWYELGSELEETTPERAAAAYRNALALEPDHVDAHLSLGYLLHQAGHVAEAVEHYRAALAGVPGNAMAAFDLGVALEDVGRTPEAIEAYRRAVAIDPELADAHYNLAGLLEAAGDRTGAFQHLRYYKNLLDAG